MRGVTPQGDVVRRLRKQQGLTQEALSLQVGCDVKTIRNAEKGLRIDASTLIRIAESLSQSVESLLGNDEIASSAAQNVRLFWQWQEASNRRDVDGMLACYHPEATVLIAGAEGLPGGGEFRSLDGIRLQWTAAQEAFETQQLTPDQVQVDAIGDYVFARATAVGTVRTTGQQFSGLGIHEFLVKDGKFFRHTVVVDTAAIRRCLDGDG